MDVSFRDFQLTTRWELDFHGPRWNDNTGPVYLIDTATGRKYWNESKSCLRVKCFLLTLGTPVVHSIASLVNISKTIVKLVSLHHFWKNKEEEISYSLKGRLKDAGQDLLRVATAPIALVGLELAAIYGVFTPYNGRKLYATIERAQYGESVLADCFQPNPQFHTFGGDINQRNAF